MVFLGIANGLLLSIAEHAKLELRWILHLLPALPLGTIRCGRVKLLPFAAAAGSVVAALWRCAVPRVDA
jgi:hypothetical protein